MKVSVPVRTDSFAVRFPNKCMFSGKPREAGHLKNIEKKKRVDGREIKTYIELILPTTKEQARVISRYDKIESVLAVLCIIAFIAGFIVGLTDPLSAPGGFSLLILALGIGASWVMVVFFITYFPSKLILNRIAKQRKESPFEPTLGVDAVYNYQDNAVDFTIQNEEIGREFEQLNAIIQAHKPDQSKSPIQCPVCQSELHAVTEQILEASRIAGTNEDLQVICFNCGMHIPKYDLMKKFSGEQTPVVFTPINGSLTDRLYHHIKFVPEEICWYCETNPARADQALEIMMYGNVETVRKGNQLVPSNWGTSTLRIPRCKDCAQNKAYKYTHLHHYPALQVMKAHGWKIGEKPPGAA